VSNFIFFSSQNAFDEFAVDVGEAEVTALEAVGDEDKGGACGCLCFNCSSILRQVASFLRREGESAEVFLKDEAVLHLKSDERRPVISLPLTRE
jgi:hypothetical protein